MQLKVLHAAGEGRGAEVQAPGADEAALGHEAGRGCLALPGGPCPQAVGRQGEVERGVEAVEAVQQLVPQGQQAAAGLGAGAQCQQLAGGPQEVAGGGACEGEVG